MKNHSFWIPAQPFSTGRRKRIVESLDGNEDALKRIEHAVNLYLMESRYENEKPRQVHQDAKDLAAALETIQRLATEGGRAWAIFKGHAGKQAYALQNAAGGTPGACLCVVAQRTVEETEPKKGGRVRSHEKACRLALVDTIADAVSQVGIVPTRAVNGKFTELLTQVYEAAGIETDTIDSDIREFLET